MKSVRPYIRIMAGMSVLCLGSLGFLGCSESSAISQPQIDEPLQLVTDIARPTTPTQSDIAEAAVKPASGDYAAVLHPFTIEMPGGRLLELQSMSKVVGSIDIDYGCDGTVDGIVPLYQKDDHKSIETRALVILPEGDVKLSLSAGTIIAAYLPKPSDIDTNYCTKLTKWEVFFTVYAELPNGAMQSSRAVASPAWTLPINFDVVVKTKNYKSFIKGSELRLDWDPSLGSLPPIDAEDDESALAHCNFYRDGKHVVECGACMPVVENCSVYIAENPVEYDRIEIKFDLRDGHPTSYMDI